MLHVYSLFGLSWKTEDLSGNHPNSFQAELAALKETADVLTSLLNAFQEDLISDSLQEEKQRLLKAYHSIGTELSQQDLRQFLLDILEIQTNLAELAIVAENAHISKMISRESVRLKRAVASLSDKLKQSYVFRKDGEI